MQLFAPFQNMSEIDKRYTGDGSDVSPHLKWTGAPPGTESFALLCDDPDAPSPSRPAPDPWVHWVIFNISADTTELPEHIARVASPRNVPGAVQGKNSWGNDNIGYRGPMPPPGSGRHRYYFKLYALDTTLPLQSSEATKSAVIKAMKGHVLQEAACVGTYERK